MKAGSIVTLILIIISSSNADDVTKTKEDSSTMEDKSLNLYKKMIARRREVSELEIQIEIRNCLICIFVTLCLSSLLLHTQQNFLI
jgi:hypothetical protein